MSGGLINSFASGGSLTIRRATLKLELVPVATAGYRCWLHRFRCGRGSVACAADIRAGAETPEYGYCGCNERTVRRAGMAADTDG